MKANEAPERIYVAGVTFPDYIDFDGSPINTKRIDDNDVEYIRIDSFIEKAAKWINEHTSLSEKLVIENFVNYMKGE